jgi:hypothetical protein
MVARVYGEDRRRPGVVKVAAGLLAVVGLAYLVDAVMLLVGAAGFADRTREAFDASSVDPRALDFVEPAAAALPIMAAVFTILAGLAMAGCAVAVWAGSRAGRVVAWVVIGLALLSLLAGLAMSGRPGLSTAGRVTAYSNDSSGTHMFYFALLDGYSTAYQTLSVIVAGLGIVCLPLAAVLLARPPAHEFFAKRRPAPSGWAVPAGPAAFVAYPAVPYPPGPPGYGPAAGPPVYGPPAAPAPEAEPPLTVDKQRRLDVLRRQYDRGAIGDEQFAEEWRKIFGET